MAGLKDVVWSCSVKSKKDLWKNGIIIIPRLKEIAIISVL
jgi:hypothetical protein